jgi:hypothetical protein
MSILSTIETDVKAVGTVLTTDIGPATSATKSAIGSILTKKIDIFGATIPFNKNITIKIVELVCVAALAIGLIGTQLYVYTNHKKAIEEDTARIGSVEAYNKQTDTNFVNVNAEIATTNKTVTAVDAKINALAAKVAADEKYLTPARPTTAVTRKYYRRYK